MRIIEETYLPGNSVSLVARRHGIAGNQLFTGRRLMAQGALTAAGAGEEVVPASELVRPITRSVSCSVGSARRQRHAGGEERRHEGRLAVEARNTWRSAAITASACAWPSPSTAATGGHELRGDHQRRHGQGRARPHGALWSSSRM